VAFLLRTCEHALLQTYTHANVQRLWSLFEEELFSAHASERQFNPYAERHAELDCPNAPALRRANLHSYLDAYAGELPPLLLVAEAPGPWGCRFSGVPLTSEAQLAGAPFPLDGRPTSSTPDGPYREQSATIFWRVMQPTFPQFFVWNSVPLHPHEAGEPLSIRNPTRAEVRAWGSLLSKMRALLSPERTVAVGRKAERALGEIGAACTYVRHPSQGGARKFEDGMRAILSEMGL
jgi:hypothetical protein